MKRVETEHYIELQGADENGGFKVCLCKPADQSQLSIEGGTGGSAYINLNRAELIEIRDAMNSLIENLN